MEEPSPLRRRRGRGPPFARFSPAIRIEEGELNRLYEYDASMIGAIQSLDGTQSRLLNAIHAGDEEGTGRTLGDMKKELSDFEKAFDDRIPVIAGIYNL